MKVASRILVVDDEPNTLSAIVDLLEEEGYEVKLVSSGKEAVAQLQQKDHDIVITDLAMPEMNGMELLAHVKEHYPDTTVIVLTGVGTIENAVEAMKQGAFDYLTKPAKIDEILLVLKRSQEMRALKDENVLLRSQLQDQYRFDRIIGQSAPMQNLYRIVKRVAKTDSTVLITGESGTGKELIANAIHYYSDRKDKPFVPINCGAIPEELLESELFGHEKGAFTGAFKDRKGRFEMADKGTIFLDEIGEMSPKLQVKLLRFLQETKFERIGGSRTIQVDVRIIAATNKNLEKAVAAGEFREDLFYRLNVIPIQVPPLRDREGDCPLLVRHFLKQHCLKKEIPLKRISQEALESLENYAWPGNVRELENVIERLVILTEGEEIGLEDLPSRMRPERQPTPRTPVEIGESGINLKDYLEELENRLILDALKKAGGVKNKAAKLLGLNRTTLIEKMKKKKMNLPFAPN
ncbi:MAG: sigma-54-dependent Fis family transcriptional regulator [Deltaproteobacteria bacterium]|nr:sigma-54-dependent Fis family transcriptional regulator [Deltaproteobacteria bacterium]